MNDLHPAFRQPLKTSGIATVATDAIHIPLLRALRDEQSRFASVIVRAAP